MSSLDELYQELILDHSRSPRNSGAVAEPDREADGHNPLCGDRIHLTLDLEDGRIADVRFSGDGCAISTAAASVMSEAIKGKTIAEAEQLFSAFLDLLTGDDETVSAPGLGKLAAFAGVKRFPIRVKCAMLPWRTLQSALAGERQTVTTE